MAQQIINVGAAPNDGEGDPLRTAFQKTNSNFSELYSRAQTSPPSSLVGDPGDQAGFYAYDSTYFYYCFANYDGSSVIWAQITQVGNISTSQISSGNSNVIISGSGGPAIVSVGGVSNVAVFNPSAVTVNGNVIGSSLDSTGSVSAAGNITADGFFFGNGVFLTGLPQSYSNANVIALGETGWAGNILPSANVTYNLGSNARAWRTVHVSNSGLYLGNVLLNTSNNELRVNNNSVITANSTVTGNISVVGNVSSNFFIGNGSQLTGIAAGIGATGPAGPQGPRGPQGFVGATGTFGFLTANLDGNSFSINNLTSLQANTVFSNANLVLSATGSVPFTPGNVLVSGNVIASGFVTAAGNISGGNIRTGGSVSATGNVLADNVITDTVTNSTTLTLSTGSGNINFVSGSNTINMGGSPVTNLGTPNTGTDAATKQYVDDLVSAGLDIHQPVLVESNVSLTGTYAQGGTALTVTDTIAGNIVVFSTSPGLQVNDQLWFSNSFSGILANTSYFVASTPNASSAVLKIDYGSNLPVSNITSASSLTQAVRVNSGQGATLTNSGANATLVVDGVTMTASDRVLLYSQANAVQNGVYVVTQPGNAITAWQLTRSSDTNTYIPNDTTGLDVGSYFYVQSGNTGAGESYVMSAPSGAFIFGLDPITFTQFSASQVYTANTQAGLGLNGTVFSAKTDLNTTDFDGGGNIRVRPGANLVTPNIGNAVGNSVTVDGNITAGNFRTVGQVTATGNITGGNINAVNALTTSTLTTTGNALIGGNIIVNGNVSYINITDLNIQDSIIGLGRGPNNTPLTTNDGKDRGEELWYYTTAEASAFLGYKNSTGKIILATNVSITNEIVTVNTYGNTQLGNLEAASASLTGNIDAVNFRATGVVTATGNITGGNVITAGTVTATGTVFGGNLITGGISCATGNITGGNLVTAGLITATGNVIAANFSTTGNVNAGNLRTTGQITATGNITGGSVTTTGLLNLISGTPWTTSLISGGNVVLNNGTADTPGLHFYQGNNDNFGVDVENGSMRFVKNLSEAGGTVVGRIDAGGNIVAIAQLQGASASVTGNITGANIVTAGLITATGTITGANITGSNINTTGLVTATGNITGGNIVTAGSITATGTITGANISAANLLTTGLISATGRIITNGDISLTGNIVDSNALTILTSSNGNITLSPDGSGVIVVNKDIINGQANGTGNIGSSTSYFDTVFAKATSAQYADLAEMYAGDADIPAGTVVEFGGANEVTECVTDMSTRVAGVVSTNPAHCMNTGIKAQHPVAVALTGRVPVRVTGPVQAGDMMVSAGQGQARAESNPRLGSVLGKAVENWPGGDGIIEVVIGRL